MYRWMLSETILVPRVQDTRQACKTKTLKDKDMSWDFTSLSCVFLCWFQWSILIISCIDLYLVTTYLFTQAYGHLLRTFVVECIILHYITFTLQYSPVFNSRWAFETMATVTTAVWLNEYNDKWRRCLVAISRIQRLAVFQRHPTETNRFSLLL